MQVASVSGTGAGGEPNVRMVETTAEEMIRRRIMLRLRRLSLDRLLDLDQRLEPFAPLTLPPPKPHHPLRFPR